MPADSTRRNGISAILVLCIKPVPGTSEVSLRVTALVAIGGTKQTYGGASQLARFWHTASETIETTLRAVGLWNEVKDRLHTPAQQLSGGQQQRLCIARALVLKPDALLMDEPCSALDPLAVGVIEELIHTLRRHFTIVIVTHNLHQARRVGDDVALFWCHDGAGQLVELGKARSLFEAPQQELTKRYVSGGIC